MKSRVRTAEPTTGHLIDKNMYEEMKLVEVSNVN